MKSQQKDNKNIYKNRSLCYTNSRINDIENANIRETANIPKIATILNIIMMELGHNTILCIVFLIQMQIFRKIILIGIISGKFLRVLRLDYIPNLSSSSHGTNWTSHSNCSNYNFYDSHTVYVHPT